MPNHARSHNECRTAICLLCFSKTKVMRNISFSVREVIQQHIIKFDDFDDLRYPSALCRNCYTIVSEYRNNNFTRKIRLFDHSKLTRIRLTRSADKCMCLVCDTARASTTSNFAVSTSVIQKKKPGPVPSNSPVPLIITLCTHCFSELARGKPHKCTQTQKHANLLTYATSSDNKPSCGESLASSIIARKLKIQVEVATTHVFCLRKGEDVDL